MRGDPFRRGVASTLPFLPYPAQPHSYLTRDPARGILSPRLMLGKGSRLTEPTRALKGPRAGIGLQAEKRGDLNPLYYLTATPRAWYNALTSPLNVGRTDAMQIAGALPFCRSRGILTPLPVRAILVWCTTSVESRM